MPKQWRCAVVGVGVVGDWHVKIIPKLGNAQLIAVCDIQPEPVREKMKKNGLGQVPLYTDEKEMLQKEQIDIVHVCTPSGDHANPVIMALEAGKNVICE